LNADNYGALVDRYGGLKDLRAGLIRVLHDKSFTDDATRIWRALRYEKRLDFRLEATTLSLLKRDLPMLATISGERLRYELECVFHEEHPERVLLRASELGVLQQLHPSLEADGWLEERFARAREISSPGSPSFGLYFALLTYRLSLGEVTELVSRLSVPKPSVTIAEDAQVIKARLTVLADADLKPSATYRALHGLSLAAVNAVSLATDSPVARRHLELYLRKLRYVKPSLNGDDLLALGIPESPRIKEILGRLQDARLDGRVASRQEEIELVNSWL
jgi:tRNA nucleotidyltransferase (CCA-adding enzyme)